jgi:hypothetical protein
LGTIQLYCVYQDDSKQNTLDTNITRRQEEMLKAQLRFLCRDLKRNIIVKVATNYKFNHSKRKRKLEAKQLENLISAQSRKQITMPF